MKNPSPPPPAVKGPAVTAQKNPARASAPPPATAVPKPAARTSGARSPATARSTGPWASNRMSPEANSHSLRQSFLQTHAALLECFEIARGLTPEDEALLLPLGGTFSLPSLPSALPKPSRSRALNERGLRISAMSAMLKMTSLGKSRPVWKHPAFHGNFTLFVRQFPDTFAISGGASVESTAAAPGGSELVGLEVKTPVEVELAATEIEQGPDTDAEDAEDRLALLKANGESAEAVFQAWKASGYVLEPAFVQKLPFKLDLFELPADFQIHYAATERDCDQFVERMWTPRPHLVLGIDTETTPTLPHRDCPSLIQVSTRQACLLLHIDRLSSGHVLPVSLSTLLEHPDVTKACLNYQSETESFAQLHVRSSSAVRATRALKTRSLVDVARVAMEERGFRRAGGVRGPPGLLELFACYTGLKMVKDKCIQVGDWSRGPLTAKQSTYAAADAL
ncbi:hypothetical protein HK101_002152, partial [Irineochytrium annulatum]